MIKKKVQTPLLVFLIACYFIIDGLANIESVLVDIPSLSPLRYEFLYTSIPGILSNDPFSAAVIQVIPLYDIVSIYLKNFIIIIILLLAGCSLLKMKKLGLYLGLFISFFGLIFGTTYGLRYNPIEYLQNIINGITIFGFSNLSWIIMLFSFVITLFTPIYLILKRKIFIN